MSPGFAAFTAEAPAHSAAWRQASAALAEASALDPKTHQLAYIAVLAAMRLESGIPFHVGLAKKAGATRDEVISAVLLGLQPAGHGLTSCLPAALAAYDGA
jgi:alkylhydroperoxidase/carboxymuconolactone decarboxylase family protein YurZ